MSGYCGVPANGSSIIELGRSRDELITGLRSILADPHTVFYQISPHAIQIVRVVHQREDIESIFD
jgi:plasmid stabilization system protein ParE